LALDLVRLSAGSSTIANIDSPLQPQLISGVAEPLPIKLGLATSPIDLEAVDSVLCDLDTQEHNFDWHLGAEDSVALNAGSLLDDLIPVT